MPNTYGATSYGVGDYGDATSAASDLYGQAVYGVSMYGPTGAPPPANAPVITNIVATVLTPNSVRITWSTDVTADSLVNYGTTASYGSATSTDNTPVTSHTVTIIGLTAATTYHYQVVSTGSVSGLTATSADNTFATTVNAPVITNISVSTLTPTSTRITWQTDLASDSRVDYGATASYGLSATVATAVTTHSVTLSGLQPNSTYHYRVRSTDPTSSLSTQSSDLTFATTPLPVGTITNFKVDSIGPVQVILSWQSSTAADGIVFYGQTPAYGIQTPVQAVPTLSHSVTLTSLLPNTTYHAQARSIDSAGNAMFSADLQFTTPRPTGRIFTWIEPNGTSHVLDKLGDPAFTVIQGAAGYEMPPTLWLEDKVPQRDGSIVRDVLYDTREIQVPLLVSMPDYMSLLTKVRTMGQWMNAKNGDGQLQIADPDGSIRQYTVRLKTGLEGNEGVDIGNATWRKLVLTFRTTSPTPYANWPSALVFTFAQAAATATWFPIFPIVLGGVGIFSQPSITNPGDVDAEPIWTLTGPMTNPTLLNTTTGGKIALTTALLAGQSLTIDTRFRIKSVIRNDGTKLFSALSNDSSLWTMVPGVNNLSITTSGTTSASQVTLNFTPRTL